MSRSKALFAGLLAGLIGGIAMTVVMLVLACFGVATPLAIIGDRLSVFIKPGPFLSIMGRVGGYNHLKQLGVGSTMAGQLFVGALAGAIFGILMRRNPQRHVTAWTMSIFVVLPLAAIAIALWPVLGTSYIGLPIASGGAVTLIGFALSVLVFERTLVASFHFLTRPEAGAESGEFTPAIGRRALILGGLGVLIAGGGVGLLRRLYRIATFSYDGTQYKGRIVQPITPNDLFYCVTKNVIDPRVNVDLWHLEVNGLVQNPTTYRFQDLKGFNQVEQETTLMCISNGLDAGLISNAVWKGITLRDVIDPPDHESRFSLGQLSGPIEVKGIAFGGDRGISRVEISDDDGETWTDANIHYAGTKLTWALWSYDWRPDGPDDYTIVVRATDGESTVQEWEEDRSPFSGVTGFHKIAVHVTA